MYEEEIIQIRDSSGLVADLTGRAISRSIKLQRNRPDEISLVYDIDNIQKLANSLNMDVWDIFRVNENEIKICKANWVVASGQINYAKRTAGSNRRIEIKAIGFFNLLKQRYTDDSVIFSATDAGAIAWSLINTTNGLDDTGITQGTIQTSVNRDRGYSYKNVYDAIIQLSECINGFDFDVDSDKKFNVYYPKQGQTTDLVFNYPGNIQELSYERDGTRMTNKVIGIGAGTGVNAIRTISQDTASQTTYGLRESILQYPDISVIATLQEHTDGELLLSKKFIDIPDLILDGSIDPEFGTYRIGDQIRVVANTEGINDYYRIEAMELNLDENNRETVRVQLA